MTHIAKIIEIVGISDRSNRCCVNNNGIHGIEVMDMWTRVLVR